MGRFGSRNIHAAIGPSPDVHLKRSRELGLNLVSEQTDKGRLYRIKDGKASLAAADRAKQAA